MLQVARNLTDAIDGFLRGSRSLIHDRDPLFTREFEGFLRAAETTSASRSIVVRTVRTQRKRTANHVGPINE